MSRVFEERAAEEYGKGNIVLGFFFDVVKKPSPPWPCGPSDYIGQTYGSATPTRWWRGAPAREVMAGVFAVRPGCRAAWEAR